MSTIVKRKRIVVDVYHGERQRRRKSVEKNFRIVIGVLLAVVVSLSVVFGVYSMDNAKIHTVYGNEYSMTEAVNKLIHIHFGK